MENTNHNLLSQLQSTDPEERRIAAELLGQEQASPEIIAALAERLCDPNKGVRDAVSHGILRFRSIEAAQAIVRYICDENIAVRNLAGELIMQMGECAVDAVFPYLASEDPDTRKFAVDVLGLIQSSKCVDRVSELLNDINENVRYAAVEALGNLRDERSVPALMLLYAAEEGLRAPIAEALGKIGGEAAADFLLRSIVTEDSLVQFAIVEALGQLGRSQALYPLMDRISEHTGEMRRVTLKAVVGIIEQQGIELQFPETFETYFIEALQDEEHDIRLSALRGLSQFTSRRAFEAMIKQVGSDEEINQYISNVFHENPREAFRTVIETLEKEFDPTHLPVIQLLGLITQDIVQSRESNPDDDDLLQLIDRAFEALLRLWGELTGEMRYGCLDLLMVLDSERALPVVRDAVTDVEPWVRIHSLELLEQAGDAQLREYLEAAVNDESDLVRDFAQRSLERHTIPQ